MNLFLRILGYKIDESFYKMLNKQHIVLFPHTSLFEGFLLLLYLPFERKMIKDNISFFVVDRFMGYPIIGNILKNLGGITVNNGEGMVSSTIKFLNENKNKTFFISPEGSLKRAEWKSGFFHIARETGIPIIIGGIDFYSHTIKFNIEYPIYIKKDDKYEDRVDEIKELFANSQIYPLYQEESNPIININCDEKSSFLPFNRYVYFVFFIFYSIKVYGEYGGYRF